MHTTEPRRPRAHFAAPLLKRTTLAGLLALGCSSTGSPAIAPSHDASGGDASGGDASGGDATATIDVGVDAPEVLAPDDARCSDPVELAAGRTWRVSPTADGIAPPCSGASSAGGVAWGRIEVPAHRVLRLRVPGASGAGRTVWMYGDCPASACLPHVGATADNLDDRRFFNDSPAPRSVWVAARAGLAVLPDFLPAPNLRCADATLIEPGAIVDDDPFPQVAAAPQCARAHPITAPARWYRIDVPGTAFGGSTVVLSAPNMEFQLFTGCDPATCRAASYVDPYGSDARFLLRWTNRTGADARIYVAVTRAGGVQEGPFGFRFDLTGPEEGDICAAAISASSPYSRSHFTTRWGSERRAVCGDSLGRSTPVRWFQVHLQPGQSVLASAYELSSIARPIWQMYDACDATRCLAMSGSNVFANALQYTNTTSEIESLYLTLGNLATQYVDDFQVRVRTYRAAANDRCETARRVAPNTVLTGEDLTAGRTGPPRCSLSTRYRRALWYVTRVDPGHRIDVRAVNATTEGVAVAAQASCDGVCGYGGVNSGPDPVDVYYSVSQDTVPGLYATYDLVALSPLAD
ncbi:MAG: hypothetical protein Q8S73_06120 [Deltaproteobacteria bacterium]|nr:hypothetical protein [Myxococcales bacterium]MDP3213659.1 hypothetical protein [Deltaproteobacteria bacterium]